MGRVQRDVEELAKALFLARPHPLPEPWDEVGRTCRAFYRRLARTALAWVKEVEDG